jgi:hypothetical protein
MLVIPSYITLKNSRINQNYQIGETTKSLKQPNVPRSQIYQRTKSVKQQQQNL